MSSRFGLLGFAAFLMLSGTLLIADASPASAHVTDSVGYSTVRQEGKRVIYHLSLEYAILAKAVDLGPQGPVADADLHDTQRLAALRSAQANLSHYLQERIAVSLDGAACEFGLRDSAVSVRDQDLYADLELLFTCSAAAGSHRLHYRVFAPEEAVVDDHRNVVEYRFGPHQGRTVFDSGRHELAVGETTLLSSTVQFGTLGVEHILSGLDHLLFVAALLLGAAGLRDLLKVISMFTVAHSVTLMATLVGGIDVPGVVIEPLIALSIAFVAAENLLGPTHGRLPVVFGFGLLHGLGFAGSLQITDEVSWDLVASLISFNLGIEAGQVLFLAVAFPLVWLLRRAPHPVAVTRTVTAAIAATGLFWFAERLLFA
jgi:hydrogenase/urease accessory protein HupE